MIFSKYLIGDSKGRIGMTHLEFVICTKGLFHASCEIYHFAHPDIYTF